MSSLQQQGDSLNLALAGEVTMEISQSLAQAWKQAMDQGKDKVVLICDSRLRLPLASMIARTVPPLSVISYDEIVLGTQVEPVETIAAPHTQMTGSNEGEPAPV
jgi:flagellar biosynthesis component FlhA